jgi:hypothetical protein
MLQLFVLPSEGTVGAAAARALVRPEAQAKADKVAETKEMPDKVMATRVGGMAGTAQMEGSAVRERGVLVAMAAAASRVEEAMEEKVVLDSLAAVKAAMVEMRDRVIRT